MLCLAARIATNGDRDSMPLVVKEAMARGIPVVATAEVGIPEMVDESCGWLVPPNDPGALARAITQALENPDKARSRGENARQRVRERFTLEQEVAKLREIFIATRN